MIIYSCMRVSVCLIVSVFVCVYLVDYICLCCVLIRGAVLIVCVLFVCVVVWDCMCLLLFVSLCVLSVV